MSECWLIIETSSRGGQVGLAVDGVIAHSAQLDPTRRNNRDLAPTTSALLQAGGFTPKQLAGVMVSQGPGSFTGLRVGVMSGKMLAYATGCKLIAVPTFWTIAAQTPAQFEQVEVIADGLQGLVYAQRFHRTADRWDATEPLHLEPATTWVARLTPAVCVTGPGVILHDASIPQNIPRAAVTNRGPSLQALFQIGSRLPPLARGDLMQLEPLYLRPSSAEEQAARAGK